MIRLYPKQTFITKLPIKFQNPFAKAHYSFWNFANVAEKGEKGRGVKK